MLTCKEVAQLLSTDAAREGKLSDRLRVKLHLFMCKHCREYAAQLRALGKAAHGFKDDCTGEHEALDRLEEAILEQIQKPGESEAGNP
jgi:predicted anti-sigma-YlaC factor YlaD